MVFKSYLRVFSVALAAMSMAVACGDSDDSKKNNPGPKPGGEDSELTFTLSATNPTDDGVDISIVPSNDRNFYYWEITEKAVLDQLSEEEIAQHLLGISSDYLQQGPLEASADQVSRFFELDPGTEYYLWAVGYDYMNSSLSTPIAKVGFTTLVGEYTDGYKAWLGDWTVVSTTSLSEKPLTFKVKIESLSSSKFNVTGWTTTVLAEPVMARFDKETNALRLMCTSYGQQDAGGNIGLVDVYYMGACKYGDGYTVVSGEYAGLEATMGADKQSATAKSLKVRVNSNTGPLELEVVGMEFMAIQVYGDDVVTFTPAEGFESGDFAIGPFAMTKTASGTVAAAAASQKTASVLPRLDYLKRQHAVASQRYSFVSSELRSVMQTR